MSVLEKPRFRLRTDEDLAFGLARVMREQLAYTGSLLKADSDSHAIYEVRKSLKKMRSFLRLIRYAMAKSDFREQSLALAEIGRLLAEGRDREVMLGSFTELASKDLGGEDFARVRQQLARVRKQALRSSEGIERARRALTELAPTLLDLDLHKADPKALARGFKRIRRQIARTYDAARAEPSTENLHELRKQIKHGVQALRLFGTVWKAGRKKWLEPAQRVAGELGLDHDLALLRAWATRDEAAFTEAAQREHFLAVLDRRRGDLTKSVPGDVAAMLEARPRGLKKALRQIPAQRLEKKNVAQKKRGRGSSARDEEAAKTQRKKRKKTRGDKAPRKKLTAARADTAPQRQSRPSTTVQRAASKKKSARKTRGDARRPR